MPIWNVSATGTNDGAAINTVISGASSGDTILLADGTYDIETDILLTAGITLQGTSEAGTILKLDGTWSGVAVYSNGVNDTTVKTLTVDGNGEVNTSSTSGGVQFRNSSGHTIQDVTIKNCRSHQLAYAGVSNSTATRVTTSRSSATLTGTSHGLDIDLHSATPSSDITITDCVLQNGTETNYGQAAKVESATGISYNGCTFRSEIVYGDNAASTVIQATYSNCTFDGVMIIALRAATSTLTVSDSTFTANGGCVLIQSDINSTPAFTDNTFLGRNKILGFNGTSFTSVSNYTEERSVHNDPTPSGDITMFASYNDTGADTYSDDTNNKPYITPNTARTSYEALIEDANLDGNGRTYALLSGHGTHMYAGSGTTPLASFAMHLTGYPGRAVLDISGGGDFINSGNYAAGSTISNLEFTGGNGGTQALVISGGGVSINDCVFTDNTSTTIATCVYHTGGNVTITGCTFKNHQATSGSASGACVYSQSTGSFSLIGCKFIDITENGGTLVGVARATAAVTGGEITGCEFIRCVSTGTIGAIYMQNTNMPITNCTFSGNTGTTADIYGTGLAIVVKNCILPDGGEITHTGGTFEYNLFAANPIAGTGNQTASPTYVDSANDDYNLTAASEGLNDGAMGVSLFKQGANGEPFPGFDVDIGANQSTHGPFHPVNL